MPLESTISTDLWNIPWVTRPVYSISTRMCRPRLLLIMISYQNARECLPYIQGGGVLSFICLILSFIQGHRFFPLIFRAQRIYHHHTHCLIRNCKLKPQNWTFPTLVQNLSISVSYFRKQRFAKTHSYCINTGALCVSVLTTVLTV